ncbi:hypothetical protein GGQ11_002919 [Salinibacter ruber]|uniref:Uncharacterized protein n=1 Tax=Salinibacter ruber TaxID=146919 RepID=A0AAW5PBS1_9BACT|nr:hypothetical protein [Salinibacter ruber]MCS3665498.1 hypothetical protein [Salinibacter ruber]MCS4159467.1 hypothetical protein [Salinibacter ruber]MCS4223716.1 hypothetical protein [Salinibacter ruber]
MPVSLPMSLSRRNGLVFGRLDLTRVGGRSWLSFPFH